MRLLLRRCIYFFKFHFQIKKERPRIRSDSYDILLLRWVDSPIAVNCCYHGGHSEIAFREAVAKRYPRSAYTITDKLSMFMIRKEEEIPGFFEGQLERLGVDYVDYYWLHGLNKQTYQQAEEMHAFEFIQKKKEEGKIRHIGLSFHDSAAVLEEILTAHPEMEYVQIQLNYLDWKYAKQINPRNTDAEYLYGELVTVVRETEIADTSRLSFL